MFLARVKKKVVASEKHSAYHGKRLFIVKPVYPDGREMDAVTEWIAVDYVGAGPGDMVVCGGAPGVAKEVFDLELAPIRTLIMAIVDHVDYRDI